MIQTPTVNCPSQETEVTSTPTRPVDNVVITKKGLQDRNINILAGTAVENKGKLILSEISHRCKNMIFFSIDILDWFSKECKRICFSPFCFVLLFFFLHTWHLPFQRKLMQCKEFLDSMRKRYDISITLSIFYVKLRVCLSLPRTKRSRVRSSA